MNKRKIETTKELPQESMRATVTDLVFASIVKATYTRKRLNYVMIFFVSFVGRNVIDTGLYLVFRSGSIYLDLGLSVSITLSLIWLSPWIEDFVCRYEPELRSWTNLLIDNYTFERYKLWRKRIVFSSCLGLLGMLYLYEVTSQVLMLSVSHFMITSYVIDKVEDYRLDKGWLGWLKQKVGSTWSRLTKWLRLKLNQPSVIMHRSPEFISSYYPETSLKPDDLTSSMIELSTTEGCKPTEMLIGRRKIQVDPNYKG